jgi:hypothetical protein
MNTMKTMTPAEAIGILIRHNEWRRGSDTEMVTPEQLGEAIDVVTSAKVFTFTTTDPQQAMRWAKADDMACAIWELVYNGWRQFKETDYDYETAWEVLRQTLEENSIDIDDIWN